MSPAILIANAKKAKAGNDLTKTPQAFSVAERASRRVRIAFMPAMHAVVQSYVNRAGRS